MKKIDYSTIIGKKIFNLLVIEKDVQKSLKFKKNYFLCKCDCGKMVSVYANDLYHEKTKSCGCYYKAYLNIENIRFERLVALEYKYTYNKKPYWLCQCDCGNFIVCQGGNLRSGHTKSCGCMRRRKNVERNISKHFRNLLKDKIVETLEKSDYSCFLTKTKDNLQVHHTYSFLNILKDSLNYFGYSFSNNLYNYTHDQIRELDEKFLSLHNDTSMVVLSKKVHVEFHKIYGYKNNTLEQFQSFCNNFN